MQMIRNNIQIHKTVSLLIVGIFITCFWVAVYLFLIEFLVSLTEGRLEVKMPSLHYLLLVLAISIPRQLFGLYELVRGIFLFFMATLENKKIQSVGVQIKNKCDAKNFRAIDFIVKKMEWERKSFYSAGKIFFLYGKN